MNEQSVLPPPPQHVLSRKEIWRDVKARTWVVWDFWKKKEEYEIEFMRVDPGSDTLVKFENLPWATVFRMIDAGKMRRVSYL